MSIENLKLYGIPLQNLQGVYPVEKSKEKDGLTAQCSSKLISILLDNLCKKK